MVNANMADAYNYKKLITRWDSERELFYDDIVHVLQNTKLTVQRSGILQKFYDGIRLAVEFENNNE